MITPISVPASDFESLARGEGSEDAIALLRAGQLSKRLLMLHLLASRFGPSAGLELLVEAQRSNPGAFEEILTYPTTGSWLSHSLRTKSPLQLNAIAASAAVLAGLDFEIEVPIHNGAVCLPMVGAGTASTATVTVRGGMAGLPNWRPLRRIELDDLRLVLDDLDPFRGHDSLPLMSALTDRDVERWQVLLADAWQILKVCHPHYASAIGAGLRALVPLASDRRARGMSATSREAFGSCALSEPSDPAALAVTLLHEFQHGKLNALLDLTPLIQGAHDGFYYAPWREDPRPATGLLHGIYAYVGVTDFWRVQRTAPGSTAYAHVEFVRWRQETRLAAQVIEDSGALTPDGMRFVAALLTRLDNWDEPVPENLATLGHRAATDHRICWRLRNLRPDPLTVRRLARAFLFGGQPTPISSETVVSPRALENNPRLDLLYLRLRDRTRHDRLDLDELRSYGMRVTWADVWHSRGDDTRATAAYLNAIRDDPYSADAWAGLSMAHQPRIPALASIPEVVAAVYRELGSDVADPLEVARWLAPLAYRAGGSISSSTKTPASALSTSG